MVAPRATPRHARHREALPPRVDRALPRRRPATVGPPRAGAQPQLLAPVGGRSQEARTMIRRLSLLGNALLPARPGRSGGRAPARQLHDQPVRAGRGRRRHGLRPLRRRHGRDPDAAARPAALRRAERAASTAARLRSASCARRSRTRAAPQGSARPASRRSSPARGSTAPRGSTSPTAPTRGGSAGRRSSSARTHRRRRTSLRRIRRICSGARSTSRQDGAHRADGRRAAGTPPRGGAARGPIGFASLVGRDDLSLLVILGSTRRRASSGAPRTRSRPATARRS